jgi:hypothetical protein
VVPERRHVAHERWGCAPFLPLPPCDHGECGGEEGGGGWGVEVGQHCYSLGLATLLQHWDHITKLRTQLSTHTAMFKIIHGLVNINKTLFFAKGDNRTRRQRLFKERTADILPSPLQQPFPSHLTPVERPYTNPVQTLLYFPQPGLMH